MRSRFTFLILILAAALAGPAAAGYRDLEEQVVFQRLPNGLRVIVLERHLAPVMACRLYVEVGSIDDPEGRTGVCHMLERMAFKGTDVLGTRDPAGEAEALQAVDAAMDRLEELRSRAAARIGWPATEELERLHSELERVREEVSQEGGDPTLQARQEQVLERLARVCAERRASLDPEGCLDVEKLLERGREFQAAQEHASSFVKSGELARALIQAGGRGLSASTTWESTQYSVQLPSDRLEQWMRLQSEAVQRPVFREFYRERERVQAERRRRTESQPIPRLLELFTAAAYVAHPYRRPALGWESDLERLRRADAMEFFRRHHVPSRMIVVVVGDVDAGQVFRLAEKYLGNLPAGDPPPRVHTVEPPQAGERRVTLEYPDQPFLVLGYHLPPVPHRERAAHEVLAEILAVGNSSRLHRSLVEERGIARWVSGLTSYPGRRDPGMLCLLVASVTREGQPQLDACEESLREEFVRVQTEGVTPEELARVKTNARAQLIRSLATNGGMAAQLAGYEALTGDWRHLFREMDRISAVTADDVRQAARETLVERNLTVARIVPPARPPEREEE